MAIISISLNDSFLRELDAMRREMGFAARSELIRAGIRSFAQEEKQRRAAKGRQSAILMVVHADEFDAQVAGIKHDYEDLVRTHLHNKIDGDRCVELFVLDGEGERIAEVTSGFRTDKKMDTVKLVML
ncbi:MAG: CopG family ribbon-helix-helix protein [Thaumarchaeota archaeon]|nr:CopG family ribbon-helix-helix protein [Nitrososphaerota archaeon]RNJ71818.1 MAG: ribbon-helix-helix protein, CopG family [Thaumarchaeota archaeon S14]RNJ72102.1 MAG: ribbon-helix-helix protein, CopG family [Thaumarchaeota archaeon S15]MDD9809346.1 CopG family ribbon-helix-helix protein [Nitrososphaerota archaeon]MDD9813586.1 CopG family ribbon-helix-helix protein [Nitrososphaerota archaeon]